MTAAGGPGRTNQLGRSLQVDSRGRFGQPRTSAPTLWVLRPYSIKCSEGNVPLREFR